MPAARSPPGSAGQRRRPGVATVTLPTAGWTSSNLALVPLGETGRCGARHRGRPTSPSTCWPGSPTRPRPSPPTACSCRCRRRGWWTHRRHRRRAARRPAPARRHDRRPGRPAAVRRAGGARPGERGEPVASGAVTVYPGGTARPDTPTLHVRGDGQPPPPPRPGCASVSAARCRRGATLAPTSSSTWAATWWAPRSPPTRPSRRPPPSPGSTPRRASTPSSSSSWPATACRAASVAVAKDGRVVYAQAYGTADPTTGAPVRVDCRFRYASMTKVITAAAVLQLVQAGQPQPRRPRLRALGRHRPAAGGRRRPARTTSPSRDLLDHTSGINDSPDVFFNQGGGELPAGWPEDVSRRPHGW